MLSRTIPAYGHAHIDDRNEVPICSLKKVGGSFQLMSLLTATLLFVLCYWFVSSTILIDFAVFMQISDNKNKKKTNSHSLTFIIATSCLVSSLFHALFIDMTATLTQEEERRMFFVIIEYSMSLALICASIHTRTMMSTSIFLVFHCAISMKTTPKVIHCYH
jgi:hypothetical protein